MFLAFGATSSMVMGVSSIMPMIPSLARVFDVSITTASLVITIFTMPGIVFALFSGLLADRIGRRAVLAPALLLFVVAGVGCAFATSFEALLVLRFFQGMGAAPLGVLNATIIADTWSGREMTSRIGYNIMVLNICTAIYPSLGGLLAHFDWRFPFMLPVLALPVFLTAAATPLASPGAVCSIKKYVGDAFSLFRTRRMAALYAMTFVTFLLLFGPIITGFPVFADARFAASPATIGSVMIFSSIGAAVTSSQLGRLMGRFSPRSLLVCSQALYVVSLAFLPNLPQLGWMLLPVFMYGMGMGLNTPNVQAQLLQAAPAAQRASVMAVNGMLLRFGQTLAPVCFSFLMARHGPEWGLYSGIVLALVLAVLAVFFLPGRQE